MSRRPSAPGRRIAAYVLEQHLQPGDRLPAERTLATLLGISRPALREATRRLIDLGILEPRLGDGTYLAAPDPSNLMVVRLRLEPLGAALAATRATEDERRALRARVDELAAALPDAARFAELDVELHRAVAVASHNPVLIGAMRDLEDMLSFARVRTAQDGATRETTLAEMTALIGHVAAGDAGAAEAAMVGHLVSVATTAGLAPADIASAGVAPTDIAPAAPS